MPSTEPKLLPERIDWTRKKFSVLFSERKRKKCRRRRKKKFKRKKKRKRKKYIVKKKRKRKYNALKRKKKMNKFNASDQVLPHNVNAANRYGIPIGRLDGDPGVRPAVHVFVRSKADWFEITDGLLQYEQLPPRR